MSCVPSQFHDEVDGFYMADMNSISGVGLFCQVEVTIFTLDSDAKSHNI